MKHLPLILFLVSNFCYSQTNELYKLAFNKIENFKILTTFGDKIPKQFTIIDTTETWNPATFFLKGLDLRNPKVIDSIKNDEHHAYHNVYFFSNQKLDSLIPSEEKKRLSEAASKSTSNKVTFREVNYKVSRSFDKPLGFYFVVTSPLYSTDNQYAFLKIYVKKKEVFLGEKMDNYFAILTIMFQKSKEQKWTQIGIKEHLIL